MVQKGKSIASALSAILNLKLPNFIKEWFLTWPSIAVLHSIVIRNIFFSTVKLFLSFNFYSITYELCDLNYVA